MLINYNFKKFLKAALLYRNTASIYNIIRYLLAESGF